MSGLVVAPERPDAFAGALAAAIGDPALRSRLGAAAEARVRGSFDVDVGIGQLQALFTDPKWQETR